MKQNRIKTVLTRLTAPRSVNPDEAIREYMTKVSSLILGITAFIFTIIFFIGWFLGSIPPDTLVIMILLTLIFSGGLKLASAGHWRAAGYLPPLVIFLIAIYGNIIGGAGAPAMIIYAVSIVLTAILQGQRTQWIVVVLSIAAFIGIGQAQIHGLIHQIRTPETHFTNRAVIVAISYSTIGALVWFLVGQYRQALSRSRAAATELQEYSAEISDANRELETEIAERKLTENALLESEERYRSLFEYSREAIIIAEPPSWHFQTANQACIDMFRITSGADNYTDLTIMKLSPEFQPDGLRSGEKAAQMIEKAMSEGWHFFEWQFQRLDGNEFPATVLLSKCELIGRAFLQVTIRDVTERRRYQDLIELSEEKYRSLVEKTKLGIATVSPKGEFTYVNEALLRMLGYESDEMIGRFFIDFIHTDDRERILGEFRYGSQNPRDRFEVEFRFMHKDGREVHIYSTPTAYRFKDTILGFNAIILDITRMKQAEEQIRSSLKEKEFLLKEIHHRVKNNFQIIISLINLQANTIKEPHLLRVFNDSTNRIRAMALVHEKLYRSEDISKIDFSSYMKTITEELHSNYTAGPNRPRLHIEADDIHLGIDQAIPCGLIVNELITNALKYAFPGGGEGCEIRLSLRLIGGNEIALTVGDNGVGFPRDIDIANATSLGMQLVSVLINQIHGTITLMPGSGTTWLITFPVSCTY